MASRRRVRVVAALLAASALLAACGRAPGATGKAILTTALLDAKGEHAVHELLTGAEPGAAFRMVNDIGSTEGRQVITSGRSRATVLVIAGVAYLRANAYGIVHYFGLPASATRWANRWLSIPKGANGYSTVAAAVTLSSDFGQYAITQSLSVGTTTRIDGTRVQPLRAHVTLQGRSVEVTFYVTSTGPILPVRDVATSGALRSTATWSDWGEALHLTAPRGAIPLSTALG